MGRVLGVEQGVFCAGDGLFPWEDLVARQNPTRKRAITMQHTTG